MSRQSNMKKNLRNILKLIILTVLLIIATGCNDTYNYQKNIDIAGLEDNEVFDIIEDNLKETYIVVNNNIPVFSKNDIKNDEYINLFELDSLGRTGQAKACLGPKTLPSKGEKRGSIGMIKPSGWETKKYDKEIVDGMYIYNRCHQIAWCLSGLNADERNLMTGTRSFNVDGMLPFEEKTLDYIEKTNNHVLYESTPIFKDDELVARALHLQAQSVEDDGLRFNVLIMNKQDGIQIDYKSGKTQLAYNFEDNIENINEITNSQKYILNKNTMRFHRENCQLVETMKLQNKKVSNENRETIIKQGYMPCQKCKP